MSYKNARNAMKPAISYYGGKQRMAHHIVPLIPKHTVYVEPFAGGLAILFSKPLPQVTNSDFYREVINDKDDRLINFYRQLRNNGDALVRLLELTPYSESEYRLSKQLDITDDLERARRYFVNINQSFVNKLSAGWGRVKYGENLAKTWRSCIENLPLVLDRIKDVHITCADALKVIKDWDSPQTFFYCDPPYPNTEQGHYSGYTLDDYRSLITTLDDCEGSFIVSNYHQNIAIPDDWEQFKFEVTMSAPRRIEARGKRVELVYRRLNRVPVRHEIQKIYDSDPFRIFNDVKVDNRITLL